MKKSVLNYFTQICEEIERDGLKKNEKVITTPQGAKVGLSDGREVINMCANNYLGLGNNKEIIAAAKESYIFIKSQIENDITERLLEHPAITDVSEFEFTKNKRVWEVIFTVYTIYGTVEEAIIL